MKGWQEDVPKYQQAHRDGDWYYADYLERERFRHRVRDGLILFLAFAIIVLALTIVLP